MDEQTGDKSVGAGGPTLRWRVLCIDDEPEILALLRATLAPRHEVITARNGAEALRIIGFCEPDFIICDVRMPGLDGYETVATIRRHPDYSDIPVFFLTAVRSREAARKGFEVGCNLFLYKPFDPVRLLENVDYFTRRCGRAVRPKSRSLEEVQLLLESTRQEAGDIAAKPPQQVAAAPADEDASARAEREALLEDRQKREREFWQKRFAEIQKFIDRHMR